MYFSDSEMPHKGNEQIIQARNNKQMENKKNKDQAAVIDNVKQFGKYNKSKKTTSYLNKV